MHGWNKIYLSSLKSENKTITFRISYFKDGIVKTHVWIFTFGTDRDVNNDRDKGISMLKPRIILNLF